MTCEPTDRLMQTLKVHAPGAPDGTIQLELFNIIDEFLRRTSAWHEEIQFDLVRGQSQYPVPAPGNAAIVRLLGITHNNVPVQNNSTGQQIIQNGLGRVEAFQVFPDGDASYDPDATDLNTGTQLFTWAIYRPDYITVTGNFTDDMLQYPMKAFVVYSVARSCLECDDCGDWDVPEWMWDMYFTDWMNGALASLYGMPSKPWSNPQLAVIFHKKFRNKMAFRKQEVPRGFTWGQPGPWRFPRNGWT